MHRLTLLLFALSSTVVRAADEGLVAYFKPSGADQDRYGRDTIREPGRCTMYDTCGSSGGMFGPQIPCIDNGPARPVSFHHAMTYPVSINILTSNLCPGRLKTL